jgi:hypothetical protein
VSAASPVVPPNPLADYFRGLPKDRKGRLAEARALNDVSRLAKLFKDSVEAFSSYGSLHPFRPYPKPLAPIGLTCTGTEHIAARLEERGPEGSA